MYAAWEAGVWKALAPHLRPDVVAGASAGALNGYAIAGGATPDDLSQVWLDGSLEAIELFHAEPLARQTRDLAARFQPRIPFGLTIVEARSLRVKLVRNPEVDW